MTVALEAKERENAVLQERAAIFAIETQKVENLRALRLAREAAMQVEARKELGKTPTARKNLAA
ncbi:hypothetical protein [Dongia deserti]|uniref:hypothetical protein n=1 Tax=Dongia deserti TaxID=2268030 RepID=UPI000E64856E|nr:hypothetical protein [Dongia deserti]